jgi:uncharacterized membrane protein
MRALAKTVTWRIVGSTSTATIAWLVTGSVNIATTIFVVQAIANTILYFIHEVVWDKI